MASFIIPVAISLGGMLLQSLFGPKPKDQYGSRLSDINVPSVSPGNPIVRHWGTMKLNTQLIWTSQLIETRHEESQDGGGKGAGGGSPKQITYTYSVDCAVGVCAGPVASVLRVRANQKLIWVNPAYSNDLQGKFEPAYFEEGQRLLDVGVDVDEAHCSAFFFAFNNYRTDEYTPGTIQEAQNWIMAHPLRPDAKPTLSTVKELLDRMFSSLDKDAKYETYKKRYDAIAIYLGTDRQLPDPTIESYKGVGNVPAFRGVCYMVFKNLQLEDFGNTIPSFQVEVMRNDGTVYLHEVIADICRESGLSDDQFNVTCGLNEVEVLGYAMTDITTGRDAIQQLQKVYPFDATETAYTLRFGWIEKRMQAIIRREDFGAHEAGQDMPASEEVTRVHDFDLPKKINFTYQEPARNYSTNTVVAQRQITEANLVEDYKITIAMTRAEAKSRVEAALTNRFLGRRTYKVVLPRKYVILEPGDAVLVPDKDAPEQHYGMRVLQVSIGNNGLIEVMFSDYFYHGYVEAIASEDIVVDDDKERGPSLGSRSYAYMLDIPLLSDTESDNIGFYTVMSGTRASWSGGILLVDFGSGGDVPVFGTVTPVQADGALWYNVARNDVAVPHGFALSQLGPAIPGVWDYKNSLTVKLLDPEVSLSSASQTDLLSKMVNIIIVGDEILQFADAIDQGNGIWELRTLLRGLRGTEWAVGTHQRGERFIRLATAAVKRVTHDQARLNVSTRFRVLTFNQDPDEAEDFYFTDTGNSLRPYSPCIRKADRVDGGVQLEWLPRVRQNGGLLNGTETPLDQDTEQYEIDVLKNGAVLKTFQVSNARSWSYPAAGVLADFGSAQEKITLRLYQIGKIVGRGFAQELTI